MSETTQGPLNGIRILDLTRMIAGPFATQTMSDMGAVVYKIERPHLGDDTRHIGPFMKDLQGHDTNESAFYIAYNRGKYSVTVDIAKQQGAELVRRLMKSCDIVIENFKVGTLERYGLDYQAAVKIRPDIIYCSITGFGDDGPYASRPAYDSITQGMAGLMSTNGSPESLPGSEPLRTAVPISDLITGLHASTAILAALHARDLTGIGQRIDISLFDASVGMNGHLAIGYLLSGRVPRRNGNENPVSAPSEAFACRDGRVMIAIGNNSQFDDLCRCLGLPDLRSQPKFANNTVRAANRPELHEMIEAKTLTYSVNDLIETLGNVNVPIGGILPLDQVFRDPQVLHRKMVLEQKHHLGTMVPMLRNPVQMSKMPIRYGRPPALGEHTKEVLAEELGIDNEEIERLRDAGII